MKKMKKILIVFFTSLLFFSCSTVPINKNVWKEEALTRASKPVEVISVGQDKIGQTYVTFRDARGKIFTIQNISFASLKTGDIIY